MDNDKIKEVLTQLHLDFHYIMMFCSGAQLACEHSGDKAGVKAFQKLIDMSKESADRVYDVLSDLEDEI